MQRWSIVAAAATALTGMLAAEGQAQTPGEVRVYEENDFFNPFTKQTDRYYTQGLKVEWLSSSEKADGEFLPGISHSDWCRLFCSDGASGDNVNTGYAVGQNIYTPANIEIARPQPYDRPWAGMLYVSRIARVSYQEFALAAQRQDRIELSLGIVGPAALAKEAQTEWHNIIGAPHPAGWSNQLGNEPVVQLRYDTALRWHTKGNHMDLIPRVRGNLGNAFTSLEAEVTGRIGWNLSGFGVTTAQAAPPPPAPAMIGGSSALMGASWLSSGSLFLRGGLKAVARNIFLDGNSFADNDIRIDRKFLVPEIAAGAELNLVSNFWVTFQFVRRGSEFKSWRGRHAPAQEFGSLTVAWMIGH
jgi:hypothetical protein